jgi:transposase InsO family protein
VFSRRIVGWQLAGHMRTDLMRDALRMALGTRDPGADFRLVAHTDRGSQPGLNRSSQQCLVRGTLGGAGDGPGGALMISEAN